MLRLTALILLIQIALVALPAGAAEPSHALVQVFLEDPGVPEFLAANRGRLDIVWQKPGVVAHIAARTDEVEFLRQAGLRLEVLHDDLEGHYRYRDKGAGFGVYHTWSESVAFVDSLRLLYPNVVSAKWSLGKSHQDRDIWCFRVSANPDIDEDEPEILIDGMHHAREIMASEFPIMFAEYLAQNYGTDPEVTWLLDNRELYVVPIVNPDGFVYNEQLNPNGGTLWRKNMRDNGDGTTGVDLNRNYPFEWGYDDDGSSPVTDSEIYRGPAAGSEPEVQAMMNFINGRQIRTHDTVHTYSNLTLVPWGYTATNSPDHAAFVQMADQMTKFNGYTPGQPAAILYTVNGGAFDWAYGAQGEHAKILSFSNEIGGAADGFWPAQGRRQQLFEENIWPHIYLMRAAGPFVAVHSAEVLGAAKAIEPGQSGDLTFIIENQSAFSSFTSVDLTLKTDDPWIQLGQATRTVGPIPSLGSVDLTGDPIPVSIESGCPQGHLAWITVVVHMAEGDLEFPVAVAVGSPTVVFTDDMENGTTAWTLADGWAPTGASYRSPANALTDSPGGDYANNVTATLALNGTYQASTLNFWHRYGIEEDWDYGRVQVSAGGGAWNTLASFTGYSAGFEEVTLDLSAYAGNDLAFRFVLETDTYVVDDGWYLDDLVITGTAPVSTLAPPLPVAPGEGAVTGPQPALTVVNTTGPGGSADVYGFRIYGDALCTDLVAAVADVPAGTGQTAWIPSALADGTYWWRAWAGDGTLRSDLSPASSLTVTAASPVDLVVGGPGLRILGNVTGAGTRLELALPTTQDVTVDIYDPRGARVRRLHTGPLGGGTQILVWDGKDSGGRAAASGVYFVQMRAGREVLTGKVVIVR